MSDTETFVGIQEALVPAACTSDSDCVAKVGDGMCLQVISPFAAMVNLGRLAVGEHRVRFLGPGRSVLEKIVAVPQ